MISFSAAHTQARPGVPCCCKGMEIHDDAVQKAIDSVKAEVAAAAPQRGEDARFPCPFCPFRSFTRQDRWRHHIQKYHAACRLFTANSRTEAQWNIVLAVFEQDQAGVV